MKFEFVPNRVSWQHVLVAVGFVLAVFLSFYRLTESPPTWMDEGIIIDSARSLAEVGKAGLQVAPAVYESAAVVTTSFPLTLPLAAVFKMFGVGLLQARIVMTMYLILFFVLVWAVQTRVSEKKWWSIAFLLLVTFPPIYGNGKNVLGEIPGMVFLLAFIYMLYLIEKKTREKSPISLWWYAALGLLFGLCIVTKPTYIICLPALLIAILIKRKSLYRKGWLIVAFGILAAVAVWFLIQFGSGEIHDVLRLYSNPGQSYFWPTFLENTRVIFSNAQALLCILLVLVWLGAVFIRAKRKDHISSAEIFALVYSILVMVSFLRIRPYFRYFLPAQILGLIYLMPNLHTVFESLPKKIAGQAFYRNIVLLAALLLLIGQVYSLFFTSWVSKYYNSVQTKELEEYFGKNSGYDYFLYQTPELATFIKSGNFYQYYEVAPKMFVGSSSLQFLEKGMINRLVVHDNASLPEELLAGYTKADHVARYDIYAKKI